MQNFAVCAVEVMILREVKKMNVLRGKFIGRVMRILGYVWVWVFFLCVTPGWQYPMILKMILKGMEGGA